MHYLQGFHWQGLPAGRQIGLGSIPNISFGWLTCECTCVRALCVGVWLSACRHMYAHKHANQPPHGPKVYPAAHDIDVQSPALSPSSRAAAVWQLCSVPPILTCNLLGCIVPGAVTFGSTASLFAVPPVCLSLPVHTTGSCFAARRLLSHCLGQWQKPSQLYIWPSRSPA